MNKMRLGYLITAGLLGMCCLSLGALTNNAGFLNQEWDSDIDVWLETSDGTATNQYGFNPTTGTDGIEPYVTNGVLKMSLGVATGGETKLTTPGLDGTVFHDVTDYIVTMRMNVDQFPGSSFSASSGNEGINFFDIRGIDRAMVHLESDGVWVYQANNDWELAASVTTAEDTYYTWQFEVTQVAGVGDGTIDIYRRQSDSDPWTMIATNITIRNQDVVDQWIFFPMYYSALSPQGIVDCEYLQIGAAGTAPIEPDVPAPATSYETWVEKNWDDTLDIYMETSDHSATNRVGFSDVAGDGSVDPFLFNGKLTVTMDGATNGYTRLQTGSLNSYVFNTATNYTITTRLKVDQFTDSTFSTEAEGTGITLLDIRGIDRLMIQLEPDAVYVSRGVNDWLLAASVTTEEDVYYSWKFDVIQSAAGTGTVTIYRRESDSDPWTVLAANVLIRNQDTTDQWIVYSIAYNGDNTQTQGILVCDYLQVGAPYADVAAPEASYDVRVEQNWTESTDVYLVTLDGTATNSVGFSLSTGTDGVAPFISGGKLRLSMNGATEGSTELSTGSLNGYEFFTATNYNVTTRMKVLQFPDVNFTSNSLNAGINFFDLRGMDRLYVHLEPDGVWVNHANNDWELAAAVTTAEDAYYTWQFEVQQAEGAAAGTVDIYRRAEDSDEWTVIATNFAIRGQDTTDQWLLNTIYYNADNTAKQGIVESDYFQFGYPSAAGVPYDEWTQSFGLSGDDALPTADVEQDGMDNLTEYALGGDPLMDDASSILPVPVVIESGGTLWFEYVYNRWKDYQDRGLEYIVETTEALDTPAWTNDNFTVSGTGSVDADFESVTNRVNTGISGQYFLKLDIQQN